MIAPRHDWGRIAAAASGPASAACDNGGACGPGDADLLRPRMQAFVDCAWDATARTGVSWIGFYLDVPGAPDTERLVLGPRRDRPACSPIGMHGACGTCLLSAAPLVVRDVRDLGASYIACDPRDRSELVVPCVLRGAAWGVLDVDSHEVECFSEADAAAAKAALAAWGLTD